MHLFSTPVFLPPRVRSHRLLVNVDFISPSGTFISAPSRTEARGKRKGWGPKARIVSPGKVSWEMVNEWLGPKGVILRGGGLDEAPHAYRRLPDVLSAQGETVKVLHTLTPVIVVMAGENEYDPYKD
jgi:hypothetical protein